MSGGGKGGSQTQTSQVEIPKWLERPAKDNIARANEIAQLGYVPYYGPDVAAFSPMQEASFANTDAAASAFGMAPSGGTGMPQAQTFANGTRGYSSAPLFEESLAALQANRPGQYDAINSLFIDPMTGQRAGGGGAAPGQAAPPTYANPGHAFLAALNGGADPIAAWMQRGATGGGGGVPNGVPGQSPYTGFNDMINGGGPGASGPTFQGGGPISMAGNAVMSPQERSVGGGMGGK